MLGSVGLLFLHLFHILWQWLSSPSCSILLLLLSTHNDLLADEKVGPTQTWQQLRRGADRLISKLRERGEKVGGASFFLLSFFLLFLSSSSFVLLVLVLFYRHLAFHSLWLIHDGEDVIVKTRPDSGGLGTEKSRFVRFLLLFFLLFTFLSFFLFFLLESPARNSLKWSFRCCL